MRNVQDAPVSGVLGWRRILILTHRWLGIAGCILFVTWFASGIVMMYARMPTLAAEEQLARAPVLDLSRATRSPGDAAALAGLEARSIQVGMLGDRPVYRFDSGRDLIIVFADTGEIFEGLDARAAADVARRYAPGHLGPVRYDAYVTTADQWTLQAGARMPMHRFALDDDEGTYLYISEVTGDAALRTTRRERVWAYLGPVLHWLYFAPLRRNGPVWSEIVIWSSLIGCVMCLSGLLFGIMRYSPVRRFRISGSLAASPYSGLMKWHHYAGLLFGVVTLTWAYSGLLSMAPFDWFSTPGMTRAQREASTGGPLRADLLTLEGMRAALAALPAGFLPKQLEAVQFRGEPFWAADRVPPAHQAEDWMSPSLRPRAVRPRLDRRYVSALHPGRGSFTQFDREAMHEIAAAAMPGVTVADAVWLQDYDGYYYDSSGSRPLPVLRVRFADARQTWLYLDPHRGGIVQKSERTSRLRRWLYQGLHSLDFPFLYFRRPLWDVVVIGLSLGGLVLSVTTMVPAWRRLRRHVRSMRGRVTHRWRAARTPPGEATPGRADPARAFSRQG